VTGQQVLAATTTLHQTTTTSNRAIRLPATLLAEALPNPSVIRVPPHKINLLAKDLHLARQLSQTFHHLQVREHQQQEVKELYLLEEARVSLEHLLTSLLSLLLLAMLHLQQQQTSNNLRIEDDLPLYATLSSEV